MEIKSKIYPTNPIGIISLFVFFIEAISTVSLKFLVDANSEFVGVIIFFIVAFPSAIALLFFFTLWLKRECLFAPGDFKDEENFVKLMQENLSFLEATVESKQKELSPFSEEAKNLLTIKKSLLLAQCSALLSDHNISDSELRIMSSKLKEHLSSDPLDRATTIVFGRLYKKVGQIDKAINILSNYIDKFLSSGKKEDKDYADILYNRSCYYSLAFGMENDEKYMTLSLQDLRKSSEISKENFTDAKSDIDFLPVKNHPKFIDFFHNQGLHTDAR
jgi:hypothetical protein